MKAEAMNQKQLVALLLKQFEGEEGLNCNTGSRFTCKPLITDLPRRGNAAGVTPRPRSRKKQPAPAA